MNKYDYILPINIVRCCNRQFYLLLVATDSTASDDDIPPPLPAKNRESEYTNLSDKDSLSLPDYSSPIIMNNYSMVVRDHIMLAYNNNKTRLIISLVFSAFVVVTR